METKTLLNPFDTRDIAGIDAGLAAAVNPSSPIIDAKTAQLPIFSQILPDCTCENVVKMMQRYWFEKTGIVPDLQPLFLYALSKQRDGRPDVPETFPRVPLTIAVNIGCCTKDAFPDDATLTPGALMKLAPTQAMLDSAAKWKIPGYATFSPDEPSVREALTHCKCLGITLPVGDFSNAFLLPPAGLAAGFHRLTLYGDIPTSSPDNIGLVANSWGKDWGNSGLGGYLASMFKGKIYDIMGIVDVPENLLFNVQNTNNMDNKNLQIWCAAAKVHEGWFPGSPSWANNNPGNLRYVGQALATNDPSTAGKGDWCHFKTYQDGYTTLYRMFLNDCTGKSKVYKPTMTLLDYYNVYSPKSDKNDPVGYANFVAKQIGVPVTTQIGSFVA